MAQETNFEQDPELKAMLEVFAALKGLDTGAQTRVMDYVERRLSLKLGAQSSTRQAIDAESPADEAHKRAQERDERTATPEHEQEEPEGEGTLEGVSPIARKWMRRNQLGEAQLSVLYSLGVDEIDLVASKVPGKSSRERLRNVMLLQGIASYLSSGAPRIDNEKLREAAKHYDADVGGNFATYLKTWASEVSGSRAEGNLTLTTRGLNSAKDLIKQMSVQERDV